MTIKEIRDEEFPFNYIFISGISNAETSFNKLIENIDKISNENQVIIQIFNSELIAGWEHLFFSAIHSLKAFKDGKNLSNKLNLEILLYASGQPQIKKAIKLLGIRPEIQNIAILILGNSIETLENVKLQIFKLIKGIEDESILNINENKFEKLCEVFKITPLEIESTSISDNWEDKLEAINKIILNRIAFVIIEK